MHCLNGPCKGVLVIPDPFHPPAMGDLIRVAGSYLYRVTAKGLVFP